MTHHLPRIIGTALATIVGPKWRGHHGDPQVPGVWLTTTTGDGPNIGGLELTPKLEPARVSPEPVGWRRQITMRSCPASARDWMLGARYCSGVARSIWRLPRRLSSSRPVAVGHRRIEMRSDSSPYSVSVLVPEGPLRVIYEGDWASPAA